MVGIPAGWPAPHPRGWRTPTTGFQEAAAAVAIRGRWAPQRAARGKAGRPGTAWRPLARRAARGARHGQGGVENTGAADHRSQPGLRVTPASL